jgi:hypothetical protein
MSTIDRRTILKFALGGVAAAAAGLTLAGPSESAPLMGAGRVPEIAPEIESPIEKAAWRRVCGLDKHGRRRCRWVRGGRKRLGRPAH